MSKRIFSSLCGHKRDAAKAITKVTPQPRVRQVWPMPHHPYASSRSGQTNLSTEMRFEGTSEKADPALARHALEERAGRAFVRASGLHRPPRGVLKQSDVLSVKRPVSLCIARRFPLANGSTLFVHRIARRHHAGQVVRLGRAPFVARDELWIGRSGAGRRHLSAFINWMRCGSLLGQCSACLLGRNWWHLYGLLQLSGRIWTLLV